MEECLGYSKEDAISVAERMREEEEKIRKIEKEEPALIFEAYDKLFEDKEKAQEGNDPDRNDDDFDI